MSSKTKQYKTLIVHISKGKYGAYKYRSPMYGYKQAYHYDMSITIDINEKQIARIYTKYWTLKDIDSYLEDVYQFTQTSDFTNMVYLYKVGRKLQIDNGYIRELKQESGSK